MANLLTEPTIRALLPEYMGTNKFRSPSSLRPNLSGMVWCAGDPLRRYLNSVRLRSMSWHSTGVGTLAQSRLRTQPHVKNRVKVFRKLQR